MINNKRKFTAALVLLGAVMVLNFPFPHKYPLGEGLIIIFNIPVTLESRFHFPGIIVLILLLGGLYLLAKSLDMFKGRAILAAILAVSLMPSFLADMYQRTAATGIYAIKYEKELSTCSIELGDRKHVHATCTVPLKNYSSRMAEFNLSFRDYTDTEIPFASLMNEAGPFSIQLNPKEERFIELKADIDVSGMDHYAESGEGNNINIVIEAEGTERRL
ncbi:hypothetical protein ACQCVH_15200 [Bacillus infantis]|uniref:hypothetical protein n=1 Tax=Bacillus infantis TaxID=324767 RepID=UPI003CEDF470